MSQFNPKYFTDTSKRIIGQLKSYAEGHEIPSVGSLADELGNGIVPSLVIPPDSELYSAAVKGIADVIRSYEKTPIDEFFSEEGYTNLASKIEGALQRAMVTVTGKGGVSIEEIRRLTALSRDTSVSGADPSPL